MQLFENGDTNRHDGCFVWGSSSRRYNGFERLGSRTKIAALSAVFVGMIEALREESRILAIDDADYISSGRTLKRFQGGKVRSVAPRGSFQAEQTVALKPDLVISYYIDQKGKDEISAVKKAGIPVIFIQNYLETHPLGRAEWVIALGALCGKYSEALALFREIEEHYLSTMNRTEKLPKPTVVINAPFMGVWDVPAGDSYMARLIQDAGGSYVFANEKGTGRIPLDVEKVTRLAKNADVWLNPGACRDKACLMQMDARLVKMKAYSDNSIYNCTRLLKPNGANPWWDYATLRPDLVLLDIFTLLHPEAEFSHEPVFFEAVN